jgi:hypothetical protein
MQEEKKTEEVVETKTEEVNEVSSTEETNQLQSGNNKKGGNKAVVIIMGIIIVALLAVILILLLSGNKKDDNTNKNEENKENTEIEPTPDAPINNKIDVIELDFANVPCGSVDFTIGKGTVEAQDISVHDKLGMLSTALIELIGEEKLKDLNTESDMELDFNIIDEAKKYFDVTPEMEKQIEEGFGTGFYLFYNKNNKSYLNLIIGGCTAPRNQGYYVKEKGRNVEKNTLIKSYYYYYVENEDVVENDDGTTFLERYYKEKGDSEPVYKNVTFEDDVNFDVFNTLDVYYEIIDGNTKLTKVVFNTK